MLTFILCLSLASAAGTAPNASLNEAYYALEDLSDNTPNGNNLTNNGATSGVTGIIDDAYSFDGTNDQLYHSGMSISSWSEISINIWAKMDDVVSTQRLVSLSYNGVDDIRFALVSGKMQFTLDDGTVYTVESGSLTDTTNFHMYTLTFDGTTLRGYIDASEIGTGTTASFDFAGATGDFGLSGYVLDETTTPFDGVIDEVSVFEYALSTSEIQYLNASGSPGPSQQYPFTVNLSDNFTVQSFDIWSGGDADNMTVFIEDANCYQETTNISTDQCGLANGSYFFSEQSSNYFVDQVGGTHNSSLLIFDGNYSTGLIYNKSSAAIGTASIYTIPPNVTNASLFFKANSTSNATVSINDTCLSGEQLFIRTTLADDTYSSFSDFGVRVECSNNLSGTYLPIYYNDSDLDGLYWTDGFYEERVIWSDSYYINETGNTIVTNLLTNDTNVYNITVTADGYFTEYYENYNVSSDLDADLKQSVIKFNITELATNDLLNGINYTIDGNQSITNDVGEFYLSAGTYNVTASKDGYYNLTQEITVSALDNKTISLSGMYNTIINLSALDISTNNTINTFDGWLYDQNNSVNYTFSTTNSYEELPALNNTVYSISVSPSGYATETDSLTTNSSLVVFNTSHYLFNSVNIVVKDITNLSTIDWQTVSVAVIYNDTSYINTTSDGTFILSLLAPADYELRFSSNGYITTSGFVTVLNDSAQNLVVYLDKNTTTEAQTIRVIDIGSDRVSGAIVTVQKETLNTSNLWTTVSQVETNSEGEAIAFIEKDPTIFYRFSVSLDGEPLTLDSGGLFTTKTSFISGVNEIVQIVVQTEESGDTALTELQGISYNVTYGAGDTSVTFDFVDARSTIVGGQLLIWGKYINSTSDFEVVSNQSVVGAAGTILYSFPVVNNTEYKVQAIINFESSDSVVHERILIFGTDLLINRGTGLLIGIVVLMFVAVLTYTLGPLISSVLFFASMFALNKFGMVNISGSLIITFIAISIILFIRLRGNR